MSEPLWISELSAILPVITPSSPLFNEATTLTLVPDISSVLHDKLPLAIVYPKSESEVQQIVRIVDKYNIPTSVKGGGCDAWGRCLYGNLVINMGEMNLVTIDEANAQIRVGGGAKMHQLNQPFEGAVCVAVCAQPGIIGWCLGGGYGPINGIAGLGVDNIVSARLVTPAGEIVTVSDKEHPDVYWALRGGGSSGLGVVCELSLRILKQGHYVYPLDKGKQVYKRLHDAGLFDQDHYTLTVVIFDFPSLGRSFCIGMTCLHDTYNKEIFEEDSIGCTVVHKPFYAHIGSVSPVVPRSQKYTNFKTVIVTELNDDILDALVSPIPQGSNSLVHIHHSHGQSARVPVRDTAYALRQLHFMIELISYTPDLKGDREWMDTAYNLALKTSIGGYVNILGPQEHQIARESYKENYERLLEVKRRMDPKRLFSSGIGINLLEADKV